MSGGVIEMTRVGIGDVDITFYMDHRAKAELLFLVNNILWRKKCGERSNEVLLYEREVFASLGMLLERFENDIRGLRVRCSWETLSGATSQHGYIVGRIIGTATSTKFEYFAPWKGIFPNRLMNWQILADKLKEDIDRDRQ